jgi:hypothetical protein
MKSTETYQVLREVLGPWCKSQAFKRTKGAVLGWVKPVSDEFLVFWCQCSMDGWDSFAGSKFIVEFQRSNKPIIGVGRERKRIPELLDAGQLDQARRIQNEIILRLQPPAADYYTLHISPSVKDWYLAKFKPVTERYKNTDDIWLQYKTAEDVSKWAQFILELLPTVLARFAPDLQL